ncbi:tyrosine--tRNA ligase [Aureispira anguillae]|uniref:Tyrosine--tRNA ligase n=1 Tax=Aureispira anguillae TaxID=2864201 RepID=A0A915YFG1_9BACT|nr:tyrosine--tRNA ligase [Aureispira anguillae]BDS12018.1 tyrosine--tRNA ligase [Aureispira anguillae]
MNFIEELTWRGLLKNVSEGLEDELQKGTIKGYIGYDPTAPSLTIGNLVTIMLLKHLQLHGHQPIVLMGGATGKIGDPSGKDAERQLLSYDIIDQNIERFKQQFSKLLDFEGENAAIILNNADFYKGMDVFTFLRDIGKNITVNYMMAKDSVKNRIENRDQGLSFTEFSYQLIQGYDFQYLYEKEGCTLEMGGSDQWGNITTGTHFVGKAGGKAFGLTCPLLTKSDGTKFGKSEGGNVWLAADKTSPYQFYQFWLNKINDDDIPKMLKIFSLKSRAEIEALLEEHLETNPRFLLQLLAEELTTRIHSKEACDGAKKATEIVFNKKLKPSFLQSLSPADFDMLKGELPTFYIDLFLLNQGIQVDNLLVNSHESLDSKGKIRTAIKGNALSINAEKATGHNQIIGADSLIHNTALFVQNGKKHKFLGIPYATTNEDELVLKAYYERYQEDVQEEDNTTPEVVVQQTLTERIPALLEKGYLKQNQQTISLSAKGLLFCTSKFDA